MLILWLFPVVLLGVLVAWVASVWKAGSIWSAPPGLAVTLMTLCLCYALAFLIICADPWWYDNGVREFIEWRHRWFWAVELATLLSMPAVPIAVGRHALVRAARKKGQYG